MTVKGSRKKNFLVGFPLRGGRGLGSCPLRFQISCKFLPKNMALLVQKLWRKKIYIICFRLFQDEKKSSLSTKPRAGGTKGLIGLSTKERTFYFCGFPFVVWCRQNIICYHCLFFLLTPSKVILTYFWQCLTICGKFGQFRISRHYRHVSNDTLSK